MAKTVKSVTRKAQSLPPDELGVSAKRLMNAVRARSSRMLVSRLDRLSERLDQAPASSGTKMATSGIKALAKGKSPLKAGLSAGATGAKDKAKKAKDAVGGGGSQAGGGGDEGPKAVNIVETFDVGLPVRVAYDQWTQFEEFPGFTKQLESVEQESDEKINWRAKIFLSHRKWESTIIEQIPDDRIVWRSEGTKGYVDGSVTFHELTPSLTRVLLVAEYHPDGFFEKTANLWKAQGRRLRLEFKQIQRHMMTRTLLEQQETEGWRGEIRDGEVVKTHEQAVKEEKKEGKKEEKRASNGKEDQE